LATILCVEDDQETAGLLSEALAELGHNVEVAGDGEAGFAAVMRLKPDLVISDIRMPRMSGFELLEKVAAAGPPVGDLPFVFLTALADRDNELAGRKLGADDYLTKPVDFEMLGAIVESRLHGRHTAPDPSFHLTRREKEVLTWVGRGKTSSEIGMILGLRERTVNFHCDQAMRRLDVMNRTQAVTKAMSLRLISV
jgi:DNA-binding NarL/FixJ family response regulator